MKLQKKAAILLIVITIPFLSGCFSDPVKSDLEDYMRFEFEQGKKARLAAVERGERPITSAQSMEELMLIFERKKESSAEKLEQQRAYQPKTEELKEIHDKGVALLENRTQVWERYIVLAKTPSSQWGPDDALQQQQREIGRLNKEYNKELRSLINEKQLRMRLQ